MKWQCSQVGSGVGTGRTTWHASRESSSLAQLTTDWTNMSEAAAGPGREFTSISSLPPELLAVIFEMTLSKRRVQYKLPFEVVLSHVSSLWRAVAITTPALWTKIDIYSSRSTDCAASYLQRSGSQMLLDIRVDIYNADKRILIRSTHKREALIQSIVKTLYPHIHRARSLLILPCFELTALALLSHLCNAVAPNLRRLRINIGHPSPRTSDSRIKAFSKGLPQLTFLESDLSDCVPLSLQNLTTLHLHTLTTALNISSQSFFEMISAPPSLRNLSIQGSLNVSPWPLHTTFNGSGLPMNSLKALRLPGGSLFSVKILLAISAPNLVSLWLGSSFDSYGHFFNAPGPIRFPSLKYLTIPSYDFSDNLQFPRAFPTITHLYLPHVNLHYRDDGRFKATFTSHWRHLDTLVTGMLRQGQLLKFHGDLCKFLPHRRNAGYPICQLLVDDDVRKMLKKELPDVSRYVKIDVLNVETYQEPWWIMSHERHMDHPWNLNWYIMLLTNRHRKNMDDR